jgi:hypothetical protein
MKKLLLSVMLVLPLLLNAQLEYKWANATRIQFSSSAFNTCIAPDLSGGAFHAYTFSDSINPNPQIPNFYVGGSTAGQKVLISRVNSAGSLVFYHLFQTTAEFAVKDIATDNAGNVYMAGYARYTFGGAPVDLNPSAGTFNINTNGMYIAKYDSLGNFITAKMFNIETYLFELYHLSCDNSNNVIVSGVFSYGAHFSNTPGSDTVSAAGTKNSFVAKYDSNLNFAWYNAFPNARPVNYGFSYGEQTVKPNGNPVVGFTIGGTINLSNGFTYNVLGNYDILLLEFAPNGTILNNHVLSSNGNVDYIAAMTSDANNNLIIVGKTESTMDLDVTAGTSPTTSNVDFVAKYDNAFNLVWSKEAQMGNTKFLGAATTNSNEIIFSGVLRGSFDFDFNTNPPYTYQISSNGGTNYDVFIAKYDANGQVVYAKNFGTSANTSQFEKLVVNQTNDIFVSGKQSDATDMNFGIAINNISANSNPYNFSVKYSPCVSNVTAINASICQGSSYLLPSGTTVTAAGTYNSTFQTVNGCDSIITTTLSVTPTFSVNQNASVCQGTNYTLPSGSVVSTSGTYTSNLQTINGCDSIITTTLVVTPTFNINESASICQGTNYTLPNGTIVSTTGTYTSNLQTINGCDSIITTDLTVMPTYANTESITICSGTSYELPNGTFVSTAGTYVSTLQTINGCDSIITTTLIVNTVDVVINQSSNVLTANSATATYQWIDCTNGNALINGENGQSFTALTNGSYAVIITENGCTDTSTCLAVTVTSAIEYSSGPIVKLYPNPAKETIHITSNEAIENITIFDIAGRMVFQELNLTTNERIIRIDNFEAGIYFVTVQQGNRSEIIKMIIQ